MLVSNFQEKIIFVQFFHLSAYVLIEHAGYLHLLETADHVDIPQEAQQQENRGPDPKRAVHLPAKGGRESLHDIPKF